MVPARPFVGLNLRLLIDAKHHRMGRRIDIETDDVADLGGELRVVGQLEGADAVRRQAMGAPDALHRGQADSRDLGHHPASPVSSLAGRLAQGQGYNPFSHLVSQLGDSRRPGLVVQQTRHALFHEPRLPAPDGGLAYTGCAHDRRRAQPVGRGQHDPGTPNMLLRTVAVIDHRLQAFSISRVQADSDASAHPEDSHAGKLMGIPQRTLMSASIH
jgi:hypothetical protein